MNIFQRNKTIKQLCLLLVVFSILGLTGCGTTADTVEKPTIILGDAGWDSFTFHNEVAKIIIENGYGYKTDVTRGSSVLTFTGLRQGDIDLFTETWDTLMPNYQEAVDSGDIVLLSLNYGDAHQGLYVPTYMIKGDPERGIEPMTPDLKSIKDLPKYWEVFKDEEVPTKGRIYGAIPGWESDQMLRTKIETYELDKTYNYFSPGSDAALSSSMVAAYEKGEPWLGFSWTPNWIMGKYDMTLLEDEPFSDELWDDGHACEFKKIQVTVTVNKDMLKKAPDVVAFLKNYKTSSELTSKALAYMKNNKVEADEAAKWFLKEHEEVWTKWVSEDIAQKVKGTIQ